MLHVALLLHAALLLKLTLPAGASRLSQMLEAAEGLPTPKACVRIDESWRLKLESRRSSCCCEDAAAADAGAGC
jgi:hypothetical protein